MLPPSKVDSANREKYPSGPNGMARLCEDRIEELEQQKARALTRKERSPINKQLHLTRGMLAFAKSRMGYVETPADVGLIERDEMPEGGTVDANEAFK